MADSSRLYAVGFATVTYGLKRVTLSGTGAIVANINFTDGDDFQALGDVGPYAIDVLVPEQNGFDLVHTYRGATRTVEYTIYRNPGGWGAQRKLSEDVATAVRLKLSDVPITEEQLQAAQDAAALAQAASVAAGAALEAVQETEYQPLADKLDSLVVAASGGVYLPGSSSTQVLSADLDATGRPISYQDTATLDYVYDDRAQPQLVDPLAETRHTGGIFVPGFSGTAVSVEYNADGRAITILDAAGDRWTVGSSGTYEKVQLEADLAVRKLPPGSFYVPGMQVAATDATAFSDNRAGDVLGQDGRRYAIGRSGLFVPQYDESAAYDAVVYGTGLAGLMTIIHLGMRGKRVCVLEPYDREGGAHAFGLTYVDVPDNSTGFENNIIGGLVASVYFRMVEEVVGTGVVEFIASKYLAHAHTYERVAQRIIERFAVRAHTNVRLEPKDVVTEIDGFGRKRILGVQTQHGFIRANGFADCSYEGDLMAGAVGKTGYRVGREAASEFGEAGAGYRAPGMFPSMGSGFPYYSGAGAPAGIGYPFIADPLQSIGAGDRKVQAYNFRVPLTRDPANRRPFIKPDGYDPAMFTSYLQMLRLENRTKFCRQFSAGGVMDWGYQGKLVGNKVAWNAGDLVNGNVDYPDGNWARRDRIHEEHVRWQQGLMWCVQNDPIALDYDLDELQADAQDIGLCEDEFEFSRWGHGWPHQMYVREGRRLNAVEMVTEQDITAAGSGGTPTKADSIGKWSYYPDIHVVQGFAVNSTTIALEGAGNAHTPTATYQIPMGSILPPANVCTNLVVPVCAGFSHQAWAPQRLEIAEGFCGEAGGEILAWLADNPASTVQAMPYATLAARLTETRSKL